MFHGVFITKPGKLMWQILFKSFDPCGRMRLYFNNLFVSGDIWKASVASQLEVDKTQLIKTLVFNCRKNNFIKRNGRYIPFKSLILHKMIAWAMLMQGFRLNRYKCGFD